MPNIVLPMRSRSPKPSSRNEALPPDATACVPGALSLAVTTNRCRTARGVFQVKTPALMTRNERARYERFLAAADERIARDREHLGQLRSRFHLAVTIADAASPKNVPGMYSQVCVRDLRTGRTHIQTVALPPDAEVLAAQRPLSSWASPVLLGAREGDEVHWLSGGLLKRWRVEKVLRRPGEAVPPLASSAHTSKEDRKQMAANAPMSLQSGGGFGGFTPRGQPFSGYAPDSAGAASISAPHRGHV